MKQVIMIVVLMVVGCGYEGADFGTVTESLSNSKGKFYSFPRNKKTANFKFVKIDDESSSSSSESAQPVCTEVQWQIPTVLCESQGRGEGEPCEDYNPCTFADQCRNGVCQGNWYTYCIPCRRDNDCCGPTYCAGNPANNYEHGYEVRTTGLCIAGKCEQRAELCASGCAYPVGCK